MIESVCSGCGAKLPEGSEFRPFCGGARLVGGEADEDVPEVRQKNSPMSTTSATSGSNPEGLPPGHAEPKEEVKAESVSVKPGQRKEAEDAIRRFFEKLRGDVVGILAYIDETTFTYLSWIKDARSFRILTSSFEPNRTRIEEAARKLRRPIEVYEVTSPRKGREPKRILHERWISDGKLFVDLGTDLKSSALGHTQHTIRLEPAKNHATELGTFDSYMKNIRAGSLREYIGIPVSIQHISYSKPKPEKAPAIATKPEIEPTMHPRTEGRIEVRVPPPAPQAGRPKRKEAPKRMVARPPAIKTLRGGEITAPSPPRRVLRETRVCVTRGIVRMFWEGFLVLFGLGLLIYSFLAAYGQMGVTPRVENVWSVITLIALGVIVDIIGLRGAIDKVKVFGGNAFGAVGLGLLMFSFLKTHELMGQTPQSANLVWLWIMIVIGGFLTVKGTPAMYELGVSGRKAWGSAFVAASLSVLVLSILTIQDQVGKAPQPANVTWPLITMFLGAFLFLRGFPLVREPKDSIRMAWESVSMAIGIYTAILIVLAAVNLKSGTLRLANAVVWIIILFVICVVLLAKGIGLVREGASASEMS